jgi:hypothetical protein
VWIKPGMEDLVFGAGSSEAAAGGGGPAAPAAPTGLQVTITGA